MRLTVIGGGAVGGRLVHGLRLACAELSPTSPAEVTVIAGTGEDLTLHGLRSSPEVDDLLDALVPPEGEESHRVSDELAALGVEPTWLRPSDRALATDLARSAWWGRGESLTEVTARLVGARGLSDLGVRVLPMSDVPVETHVVLESAGEVEAVHVRQWEDERGRSPRPERMIVAGLDRATPAPGVLDAIRTADAVVLAPGDPGRTIGVVLGVPGVRDALRGVSAPVVGVCPVAKESPVLPGGDLGVLLAGLDVTAAAVARLYTDFLDAWVVDPADAALSLGPRGPRVLAHRSSLGAALTPALPRAGGEDGGRRDAADRSAADLAGTVLRAAWPEGVPTRP